MLNRRSALCSLAFVTAAGVGWMGCDSQKQTELVAGISTQVQVPRDLKTVQVSVAVEGTVTFCKNYLVYDGKVQLPRSLGALPRSAAGTPVIISVTGFTAADADDPSTPAGQIAQSPGYGCAVPASVGGSLGAGGGARVLRVSRQPYSPNQILFVPMPLKFSCFDVACGNAISDKTCKAGRCVDASTQITALAEYNDNLLYGGDGTCFALDECFSDQVNVPALTVDDASCTYAVPGAIGGPALPMGVSLPQTPSGVTLPPDGLNVRVAFDSGLGSEILDLDKDEGFFVPDATKPQIFQLAPGLCDLVHGSLGSPHRITSISVNPVCRPKLASQSICAADQLKLMGANPDGTVANPLSGTCTSASLTPVPSGVEFVIDPTKSATDFLAAAGSLLAKKGDPAFANLKVGIHFMPVASSGTCPSMLPATLPDKALTLVSALTLNQADYTFDSSWSVQNQDLGLETAYAEIGAATGIVNKSVIMIANKGFTPSPACADPSMAGAQKEPSDVITAHKDITTTVVEIGSGAEDPCFNGTTAGKALASAVTSSGGVCYNASVGSTAAQAAIIHAFTAAATCTYVAPTTSPDTFGPTSELWFSDPTFIGNTTVVAHTTSDLASCRSSGTGWTQDGKGNIVLCKSSCDAYQNALQDAAALASAATPSSPKFPTVVPIFALSGGACVVNASSGNPVSTDAGTIMNTVDGSAPTADAGTPTPDACHMPTIVFDLGNSCDAYETCPINGQLEMSCSQDEAGPNLTCTCSQGGDGGGSITKTVAAPANTCNGLNTSTLPTTLTNICGFTLK